MGKQQGDIHILSILSSEADHVSLGTTAVLSNSNSALY
jgi:hypothetical protein